MQAAVLNLLQKLKEDFGTTYIFVSHDLAVVRAISDRVAVLYQGRLCEIGPSKNVYQLPSHPYTEVLLGAVLEPDPDIKPKLVAIANPNQPIEAMLTLKQIKEICSLSEKMGSLVIIDEAYYHFNNITAKSLIKKCKNLG